MTVSLLYALWGGLYVLCAGLGFIPAAAGFGKAILVLLSLCFFAPGFLILRKGKKKDFRRVRNLSILSLSVTLVLIVANVLSVLASQTVGAVLNALLILCSAPMFCGQYWVLSLFLWACLMLAGIQRLRGK